MPFTLPPVSRRSFLRSSLSAAGGLMLGQKAFAESAPDSESWIFFSDSHIAADRTLVSRGINMADQFSQCVKESLAQTPHAIGVIHSGDLAYNKGMAGDYDTYRTLIQPLRDAGLPMHLMMGNHDHREHFHSSLSAWDAPSPVEHRIVAVVEGPLANWFLLDSLDQTNKTPGVLGGEQLAWLGKALDAHADKPAIIVVHHNVIPFVPSTIPAINDPVEELKQKIGKIALQDSADLLAVLRPRQHVKACIYGHTHTWLTVRDQSGIHLINLPPTAYVFKEGMPAGWVKATLRGDSLELELRSLKTDHPQHGQVSKLVWRV